jgi:hypothetical protein
MFQRLSRGCLLTDDQQILNIALNLRMELAAVWAFL